MIVRTRTAIGSTPGTDRSGRVSVNFFEQIDSGCGE